MITQEDIAANGPAFAAAHWDALAHAERGMAEYEAQRGNFVGAYIERAQTYERCAESLWRESATGQSHCMCHLTPRSACPYSGKGLRI